MVFKMTDHYSQFTSIRCATHRRGYAILKCIQRFKLISYTNISHIVVGKSSKSGLIAHHISKMKKTNLIEVDRFTHLFSLTAKGKRMLKFIESTFEQFISDEPVKHCLVSKKGEHNFIRLCNSCMFLEEDCKTC
jgi:hypothetical protein